MMPNWPLFLLVAILVAVIAVLWIFGWALDQADQRETLDMDGDL